MPASSPAQEEGLPLWPELGDDGSVYPGLGGVLFGDDQDGEIAEGADERVVPKVGTGSSEVIPVEMSEDVGAGVEGQEGDVIEAEPASEELGVVRDEGVVEPKAEQARASSLLGYLDERDEVAAQEPAPVLEAQRGEVGTALFGCPRAVLARLLSAATARADVVSSLEIEREILTLCGERQRLVVGILQAEADLGEIWRGMTMPEPVAEVAGEPVDVVAQLTEFAGAEVVAFTHEVVEPEPEPEPEAEPEPVPLYGWLSIFGTAGDLRAHLSDGAGQWFVRVGDQLPGGVVIDWIAVSPPGVHVVVQEDVQMLPYRSGQGGGG